MRPLKKQILKYLIELLIVAFGVFLGIMVSDWRTQKKTERNVSKTRGYIQEELNVNSQKLHIAINYHQHLKRSFDSISNQLPKNLHSEFYYAQTEFRFNEIPQWTGLGMVGLDNIAFESAKVSGVFQEMNIEEVQKIARVYRNIEAYSEFSKKLFEKFLSIQSDTKVIDVMSIFEIMSHDVIMNEIAFKEIIDETSDFLKNKKE